MEEAWYLPLTVLPGVGLLLVSTASLQAALSNELSQLIAQNSPKMEMIILLKITQLDLINRAMVGFYIGAATFILSSIIFGAGTLVEDFRNDLLNLFIGIGVLAIFVSLILLSIFALRAVKIKKKQFLIAIERTDKNNQPN